MTKIQRIFTTDCNTHYICWDQHPYFNVGDIVEFALTNDDVVQAIAVKQDGDNMIFCMLDCLPGKYEMYYQALNCDDYENSDLRKKLNNELIDFFPEDLVAKLIPFENGDFFRIPTEKEIFGENKYSECESNLVEQWEPMKKRRNRIALNESDDGTLKGYWLINKARKPNTDFSCPSFSSVFYSDPSYCFVFYPYSVRPVFQIANMEE